jgi:hypothetical protein
MARFDTIFIEMVEKTKVFEAAYRKGLAQKVDCLVSPVGIDSESDRKALKEKFREPNLLIETIRQLQADQEDKIADLKLKMAEMLEIKEELSSNGFKPNNELPKNLFGDLVLNEFGDRTSFKSNILTKKQEFDLVNLCEFSRNDKWELLYRGSEHGFGGGDFHSRFDGKTNTLTIIKTTKNENVFGGFASAAWNSSGGYISDPNAFIFSLVNKYNEPIKMKVDPAKVSNALVGNASCGPIFGGGNDFAIFNNADSNKKSCSYLGFSYKHPNYSFGSIEAKEFLAGSSKFQLREIEVYSKI